MTDASRPRSALDDTAPGRTSPGRRRSAPTILPHQRRLGRLIAGQANRVLEPHEELLAISEAVEETGEWSRNILGAAWPQAHRVALLFTHRRLIEIAIGAAGGRTGGRIRSFPWDGVPSLKIVDCWLEVRTWEEQPHRWYLRDVPDPAVEGLLLKRVNLAVSTYVPSLSRTAPVLHCSRCGAAPLPAAGPCRRCASIPRSPGHAARLAVAAPGGGHLYAQRPLAAAGRLAFEIAVVALLAAGVLSTTNTWTVAGIAALGLGLVGLMKLHAALSSRLLTSRAGTISPAADRRWRLAMPVAAVLSAAVVLAPFLLAGAIDRDIDWRLATADSERAWAVTRRPFAPELAGISGLQEVWTHRDGQWILVQSWPFAPFESAARATARMAREWGAEREPERLGSHQVLQATGEARAPDGGRLETAVIIVLDAPARDIHALTTPAGPDRGGANRLRQIVSRSFWVRPDEGSAAVGQ